MPCSMSCHTWPSQLCIARSADDRAQKASWLYQMSSSRFCIILTSIQFISSGLQQSCNQALLVRSRAVIMMFNKETKRFLSNHMRAAQRQAHAPEQVCVTRGELPTGAALEMSKLVFLNLVINMIS